MSDLHPTHSTKYHVVWFKRDLRVNDHAPLNLAARQGRVVPLYVFEPDVWSSPDMSSRHRWWVTESVRELRRSLAQMGQPLVVREGSIIEVLEDLRQHLGQFTLWSHEETGNGQTYKRDKAVAGWCRNRNIAWVEHRQFGVVRGLALRHAWSAQWEELMREELYPLPQLEPLSIEPGDIPAPRANYSPTSHTQKPGEHAGKECLRSFLSERGEAYSRSISSPALAERYGSRLSPYIAWGNLSLRQIVSETRRTVASLRALPPNVRGGWLRSLSAFESRLHWHCHFIQKLESQPSIEFRSYIAPLDLMREPHHNEEYLRRWQEGMTGYPFVDACMRSLKATGWLNFRMRAMLVSFAAYDLFLDWRRFAHFLATQFLDYEPGIHYPQIQMQSGTTGINAIRMYDPVKQGHDHDSGGDFIRRWVPELASVPTLFIHEPWRLSPLEQKECGVAVGSEYPARVVDHREMTRKAREAITQVRRLPDVQAAAKSVLSRHGSRKRNATRKRESGGGKSASQLSLF